MNTKTKKWSTPEMYQLFYIELRIVYPEIS